MMAIERHEQVFMLDSSDVELEDCGNTTATLDQHFTWPRRLCIVLPVFVVGAIMGYVARGVLSASPLSFARTMDAARKDELWTQKVAQQFNQHSGTISDVHQLAQQLGVHFDQSLESSQTTLGNWANKAAAELEPTLSGDMAYEIYHVRPELNQTRHAPDSIGTGVVDYGEGAEQEIKQNLHDGNKCGGDEEEFEGLCYTKCAILTDGSAPYRESGIACCKESPCINPLKLVVGSMWACDGYDVGSENNGKSCPHSVGLCEEEEEQWGNMCYLQCNIVTKGTFPYRKGPATCCSRQSLLGCLNFMNDETSSKFDVGEGGQPPHMPELSRTEE